MKKLQLKKHLKEDEADEAQAIKAYGSRMEELREHPKLRLTIKGIRADEQKHKKKLRIIHRKVR